MALKAYEVDAHITFVDKEGPLIKVFAQTDKTKASEIEKLLFNLSDVFENPDLKVKTLGEIQVGLMCCAKFEDGAYYRGKIISIDRTTLKLKIFFVDHGNSNEVDVRDVRLSSKLLERFVSPKDQSILHPLHYPPLKNEFYLAGIAPKENEWDTSSIDILRKKICNTDNRCAVYEVSGKKLLKILNPEYDPLNIIIRIGSGYAIPLATQERIIKKLGNAAQLPISESIFNVPPPSVVMQQPPPARLPNIALPPPVRMFSEPLQQSLSGHSSRLGSIPVVRQTIPGIQVRRPEMQVLQAVQSNQFSTEMLAPGVSHPVYVSHVEDGPYAFTIQLQKVVEETLIHMMADLNNHEPQPITAPLNPGAICLGRYQDGSLCRAIVMNVMDDKVKLYFADFGSSEVVSYSQIYQIPPKFVTPKVMSHRFTLANIKDIKYSEAQKKKFAEIVDLKPLMMKVTPPEANPLKQYCELFVNQANVKTLLQEIAPPQPLQYSLVPIPVAGSQEKVFVPFVLNPGRFFVQLVKNNFSLKQIMSCVATHCRTAPHIPLVNMRPGEPCCALYEDGQWYRAEILKVNPDKAFINFVDFGNQEEIELANLRQISPELVTSVKAQAVVCCLQGYELRYDVEENISNLLEELILEKTLIMHVQGVTDNNVLIVTLIDQRDEDIGAQLEVKPSQSPIYNNYQATAAAPTYSSPPSATANDDWQEDQLGHTRQDRSYDTRGPRFSKAAAGLDQQRGPQKRSRDDGRKPRQSRENNEPVSRFNKEDKPWNKGDNRGARFNREEDGGGRFNRDENKKFGDRGGRFNEDEKPRFSRDSDNRAGRFSEDKGNRFNRDDRYNKTEEEKPWRKNNEEKPWRNKDNTGGDWKSNKEGGSWKDRESSGGGWKERDSGSQDGWRNGGGDRRNKFDSDGDFKKREGFSRDSGGDRASFRKPWDKGTQDSFGRSAPKSPKPDYVGGMPPAPVKVGDTENAQVVYTTSPVEFYVQLSKSFEDLNQLMEKIATACESGEATDMSFVDVKAGCLAKYSEDETWYRALVQEKSFDSAKVLFVDYGNQEDVSLDKIKSLPEDMCILSVQAVKCRLFGVPESAEVDAFSALVDGKTLKVQFVAKHFVSSSFQVIMVDEESGSNINLAMGASEEELLAASSKLGLTTLTPGHYPVGSTLSAQLTWYLSPSLFYLQPMASNPEFRAMMQSMQAIIVRHGTTRQNNQLNVGDFVIARFKTDKVLYRAIVKEAGFAPMVQYVDYGNTEVVDSGNVWLMEPEFATLPAQALSCSLASVQPIADAWPKADTTELDSQFEADTLECTVVQELDNEPQYLVRLSKDNQDVAQNIINAGFAIPSSEVGASSELDTALLTGQQLAVTLLRVDDDFTFLVQPPEELIELKSLEASAGEGIKCVLTSVRDDATEEQVNQFKQYSPSSHLNLIVDAVNSDGLQVTLYDGEGQLLPLQVSEKPVVDKVCPLPVLNTHQKVWIAHASEDGIFLHKTVFADLLSDLLQKLYDQYNEMEATEHEWREGEICCAKSENDEQWYRARILEAGAEMKVQFLDYGNGETLPVSNLRTLDSSFYIPPTFALKVSFHVTWTVPVENLLELAGETEYNAVVLRNDVGWVVELVDSSGQSLTEKLVELGFATEKENSPFKRVVEGGRFVEGSNIPISVSFIDSPLQLWILVGNDIELIEALQDRLQEAAPKLPLLKDPKGIFAAKFSDGLWYRALKLNDSSVRFIDYGNSDQVDMTDIKELSADFLEPAEGYAVKVELPVADFKDGITERLEELLISPEIDSEGDIVAHILSVKDDSIVADILKGGKSVLDILGEENLVLSLQKIYSGFVSNINSLNDFFVQEVGCEDSLEAIANSMSTAESFEALPEVSEGDLVAAFYTEDNLWYRAKVTKTSENGIEVIFIDYGNSALATDFRVLPSDLSAKPPIAKHCCLQLPSTVSEWSEAANEKFIEISADGSTQFGINVLSEGDPATIALNYKENCLSETLKSLCVEVAKQEIPTETDIVTGYDRVVYISHSNSPTNFFVQLEGAEVELDAIREDLTDVSSFESLEQITDDMKGRLVGAFCVDDELWYRAKVLQILEEGAEVLFVDYGNKVVSTKFIKLSGSLESKSPVAIHCTLGKEEWPEEANNYFAELSGEGTLSFYMKILEEVEPKIVSLLTVDGKLVEKELSNLFKTKDTETTNSETLIYESKAANIEAVFPNDIESSSTKVHDESLIKTVFLIQVNSPSDFFLHTAEATQLVEEITVKLAAAENFPTVEETLITKGKIVAAQFDEDDQWYRARVLEHSETETKVLFIDYGNTANVAKMKSLPDDLISTPPLAMHCSLEDLGGSEWSPKACAKFNKLANADGVSFDLKVISEGEPNLVVLYINSESVANQLILPDENDDQQMKRNISIEVSLEDSALSPTKDETNEVEQDNNEVCRKETFDDPVDVSEKDPTTSSLKSQTSHEKAGESLNVVEISHFNNVNDFFVHFKDDLEELNGVREEMSEGDSFEVMLDAEEMLAAKSTSDNLWYRAKILDTSTSGSTVMFVDYGNTDMTNEFRKLPKTLAEKKPLAKHCCLKSIRGDWMESTNLKLSSLANIGGFSFDMQVLEEGSPCPVDLLVNGRSLTKTFLDQEVAEEQSEMGEMILQTVEHQITDNIKKDVKQIIDDLILNAVDSSHEMPSPTRDQTNLNSVQLKLNETQPSNDEEKNQTDIHMISNGIVNEDSNTNAQKVDVKITTVESSSDPVLAEEAKSDSAMNGSNLKNDCKGSPPAPRRSNIDEQLVPGCISSVTLEEETSPQS